MLPTGPPIHSEDVIIKILRFNSINKRLIGVFKDEKCMDKDADR